MTIPGLRGAKIPRRLLSQTVDVQRAQNTGRDAEGMPTETWVTVYAGLKAACVPSAAGGEDQFEQRAFELRYQAYFGTLPDGTLPDLKPGDRIVHGTWRDGSPRYLRVDDALDVVDVGVVLQVSATARKPG